MDLSKTVGEILGDEALGKILLRVTKHYAGPRPVVPSYQTCSSSKALLPPRRANSTAYPGWPREKVPAIGDAKTNRKTICCTLTIRRDRLCLLARRWTASISLAPVSPRSSIR